MTYVLGHKSHANLLGVHPHLVMVVKRAIVITTQDFSVHEGLRSIERQNALFLKGASKIDGITKQGRHQRGKDGYGHAVDLVPYIDGNLRWEWELIFPVCDAVKQAAHELDTQIRWGGTWQTITESRFDGMTAREMYNANPSWDGAHFELPARLYP